MTILADEDLATATGLIAGMVADWLDEEPPQNAAEIELAALSMQAPLCWTGAPPELAHALVSELGRRGDEHAAGVLTGIACLANEPLAGLATAEARRLAGRGVAAAHGEAIGELRVAEAHWFGDDGDELWFVLVGRRGADEVQPLTVSVADAAIVDVMLGPPMPPDEAGSMLEDLDATPTPTTRAVLARRLRAVLAAMVRDEIELDIEAGRVLPLLERALTGHAGRLPQPLPAEPDPKAAEHAAADALIDGFEQHLEHVGAPAGLLEHGSFVAHTMLSWKLEYGDGDLVRWDAAELREYLLDWFPRKVTCEEATIPLAPAAVIAFLEFLNALELLESPVAVDGLAAVVHRLESAFGRACRDPHNWGPSKRLALEMLADGVEITDEAAAAAWIDAYNARLEGQPPRRAPDSHRRTQRKAARKARKRNRR